MDPCRTQPNWDEPNEDADHEDSHAERTGESVREDDQRDEDGGTEFRILEASHDPEVPIVDESQANEIVDPNVLDLRVTVGRPRVPGSSSSSRRNSRNRDDWQVHLGGGIDES